MECISGMGLKQRKVLHYNEEKFGCIRIILYFCTCFKGSCSGRGAVG